MTTASKVLLWILGSVLVIGVLLVGSCSALLWNVVNDTDAGARRDAIRSAHAPLAAALAQQAAGATDLLDAAARLRTVALPPDVVGVALVRADDDTNRITVLRNVEGRQSSRFVVNGAGSVTFEDAQGVRRTFDLMETQVTLQDGTVADIELLLAGNGVGDGPER